MSDLSPELQNLVLAGKEASRPTAADFDRVGSALQARLGNVVLPASALASTTASKWFLRGASGKVMGLAAVSLVLVVGSLALYAWRGRAVAGGAITTVAPAVMPTEAVLDVQGTPSPAGVETQPSTPAAAEPPSAASRTPGSVRAREPSRDRDSLAEEVAILSRAEAELYRGHPAKALALLNEHERKFASGALVEERTAARVQALCALGRVTEADAQLARLKPGSLHGDSSRKTCATPQAAKAK